MHSMLGMLRSGGHTAEMHSKRCLDNMLSVGSERSGPCGMTPKSVLEDAQLEWTQRAQNARGFFLPIRGVVFLLFFEYLFMIMFFFRF